MKFVSLRPRTTILGPYRRDETYENNKRYSSVSSLWKKKINDKKNELFR